MEPMDPGAMTATTSAPPAEAAGLPQFDMQWWPGQMVWFLIIFGIVLLLMKTVLAPRIGNTIEAREGQIEGDIAKARQLKAEAEASAATAAAEAAAARAAAQTLAVEARAKAAHEMAERIAAEEARLNEQGAAAEARIAASRDAAMGNVAAIGKETAAAIVAKLTGVTASAAELDAALAARG